MSKILHIALDTISGGTVTDSTSNHFNGTVNGGVTQVSDSTFGTALHFDGAASFIQLATATALQIANHSFTVGIWINLDTAATSDQTILGTDAAAVNQGLHIVVRGLHPYLGFYGNDMRHSRILAHQKWYYLTFSYDAATRTQAISVNGATAQTTGNHAPFTGNTAVNIGRWASGNYFVGKMRNLRIYDTVLTQPEINAIITEEQPADNPVVRPAGPPVATTQLPLDAIELGEVTDISGNQHPGAVQGGVSVVSDSRFGNVLQFNGSNGYIQMPSAPALGLSGTSFTVGAWINLAAASTGDLSVLGTDVTAGNQGLHLVIRNMHPYLGFYGNDMQHSLVLSINTWYYITWAYNTELQQQTISVNGERFENTTGHAPFQGTAAVHIGRWASGRYFNGKMHDLRIYDGVLTQDEVQAIMTSNASEPATARAVFNPPILEKMHLQMDSISDGEVVDTTGNGLNGTVQGGISTVVDDEFRNVLHFDGSSAYIQMADAPTLGLTNRSFTLGAWIKIETASTGDITIMGTDAYATNKGLHLIIRNMKAYMGFYANDTGHPQELVAGTWYYITYAYDSFTQTQTVGVDGVNFHSTNGHVPFQGTSDVKIGRWASGRYFNGKMYSMRMHDGVLSAEKILENMAADRQFAALSQGTDSDFRSAHPIDFDLYDKDTQNVLYIEDTSDQMLTLQIRNASTQQIKFNEISHIVDADHHHFALRFRPGTLSAASLRGNNKIDITTLSATNWEISNPERDASGMDVIYIKYKSTATLFDPNALHIIVFENVGADGGQGARGTRVELLCRNMRYNETSQGIITRREIHLGVINHRGKKDIPLLAGFIGDNGVLNDGSTANELQIRLTNTYNYDAVNPDLSQLTFNSDASDSTKSSKIIISFHTSVEDENVVGDVTEEWALATVDQVKAIVVTQPLGWTKQDPIEGQNPEWILTPDADVILPGHNGPAGLLNHFDIHFGNIITGHDTGHTQIYIRYENIPGYWDGQLKETIEKRPLLFYQKKVGIGDYAVPDKLYVKSKESDQVTMEVTNTGSSGFRAKNSNREYFMGIKNASSNWSVVDNSASNERLTLTSDGKLGITAPVPRGKFDVDGPGDIYLVDDPNTNGNQSLFIPGHIYIVPHAGGTVAYIQARRKDNSGSASLRFRTYNNGTLNEAMSIDNRGYVGIGKTNPGYPLDITSGNTYTILANNSGTSGNAIRATSAGYPAIWASNSGTGNGLGCHSQRDPAIYCTTLGAGATNAIHAKNNSNSFPTLYASNPGSGGHYGSGASDYAEYFENSTKKEIPVGTAVVIRRGKVRPARKREKPMGIISASPMMVGNLPRDWPSMYKKDTYGRVLTEKVKKEKMVPKKKVRKIEKQKTELQTIEVEESHSQIQQNEQGQYVQHEIKKKVKKKVEVPLFEEFDLYNPEGEIIGKHQVPVMETIKEEEDVLDKDGNLVMVGTGEFEETDEPIINPKYDPEREYILRSNRPEWSCVGLMGQLPLKKGQPTAREWVKMKNLSSTIELWLIK